MIMESVMIEDIPFVPDQKQLMSDLHIGKNAYDTEMFRKLCGEAQEIAKPKFAYGVSFIEEKGSDFVILDGVKFSSRVMSVNLAEVNRVFPLIATCGREIEKWSQEITDVLQRYWVDKIKEAALETAIEKALEAINGRYQLGRTSYMSPGSIDDWPLSEQSCLFALLGDEASAIGVELTESFLMLPVKTVSRILFTTEVNYQNCQLCKRAKCPNRRLPYTPGLYERRYG
jgi:hypothetical protein